MINLGTAYGEIQIGTGSAEQNVNSLASSMKKVGGVMSAAISAPLIGVAAAGLTAAAGFEQSMNTIAVVSGATESAMAGLNDKALQLGRDTSFSAGEAAQGMLELSKAGLDADQVMAAIGGTLDLAAAGSLSVAQAAEITANALNAFRLPASEAVRVADLLAAAANASSMEVTDMAQSFAASSAVFASNGQEIDDLSTAIALLANNGIKGSDAGTSLKTMLMRLAAPTADAQFWLDKLNVAVYNTDGSMRSFENIIGQLETGTANLTAEQRNMAFTTIMGSDAIRAANILVDEGAASYADMREKVNAAGSATTVAESKMKGLAGAIAYAKGTIESTLIAALQPFLDAIGGIIRQGADLIGMFAGLPQPVQNAALAFLAVLAAVGPLLLALPMIGTVLGGLLSPIGLIALAVAGLAAVWVGDFGGIRTATMDAWAAIQPVLASWAGVASDLWSAIEWIFAGQADNIDWWYDIATAFGATGETADRLAETMYNLGVSVGDALTIVQSTFTNLGPIASDLRDAMEWIFTGQADNIDWWWDIADAMGFTGETAVAVGDSMYNAGVAIGDAFTTLRDILTAVWEQITALFGPGIARLQEAFTGLGGKVGEMSPALTKLQDAFANLWTALQPIIDLMIQGFTMIAQIWGGVVVVALLGGINLITAALARLPEIVTLVVDQISLILNTLATVLGESVTLVTALINGDWATAWTSAQTIVEAVLTLISGTIGQFIEAVGIAWGILSATIIATLSDLGIQIESPLDAIATYWAATWAAIEGAWGTVWAAIEGAWGTVITWLTETFPTALESARQAFAEKFEQIRVAVEQRLNPILGIFQTMATWLETTLQNAFTSFASFLRALNLPNPLTGISSALEKVKDAVLSLPAAFGSLKDALTGYSIPNPFAGWEPPDWAKDYLPGFAIGSSALPGGAVIVGERGTELLVPRPGDKILTNGQSQHAMAGAGTGTGGTFNFNFYGDIHPGTDPRELARQAFAEFRRMRR